MLILAIKNSKMPLKHPNYLFNLHNNRSLKINYVQNIIGAGPGDKYIPPENLVKKKG